MQRKNVLSLIAVGVIVAIILTVFFMTPRRRSEGFTVADDLAEAKKAVREISEKAAAKTGRGELSKSETELFEDLKNNRLSENEVMKLVKNGILNESLVEKFLARLDSTAAELAAEDARLRAETAAKGAAVKNSAAAVAEAASGKGPVVEGFSADGYGFARY